MDIYKRIMFGGIVLVVLLTTFLWISRSYMHNAKPYSYIYKPAGISFKYPVTYVLEEVPHTDGVSVYLRSRRPAVVASVDLSVPREDDPKIMCDITKKGEQVDFLSWIHDPSYARVHGRLIEESIYSSIDIPDVEALGFKTDGLYTKDHVLFEHNGFLVDCGVEYITVDDPMRIDFVAILLQMNLL